MPQTGGILVLLPGIKHILFVSAPRFSPSPLTSGPAGQLMKSSIIKIGSEVLDVL